MYNLSGTSVDEIFALGWNSIHACGHPQESRAGKVLSLTDLCVTEYLDPEYRVLCLPERRHNPYFALMETIWMLSGSNNLDFIMRYNKRMKEYSDDGQILTGSAYGYHWIYNYGFDQLQEAAIELTRNPETRRVVISHWNPHKDPLNMSSKDLPCNLQILFRVVRGGSLNMTVYNRSNDFIYGQAGSNAVHFSILLEFMAMVTGYSIGKYNQVSNNLHMYVDNPVYKRLYETYGTHIPTIDPYDVKSLEVFPISTDVEYGERREDGVLGRYKTFMYDVHMLIHDVVLENYPEVEDYKTSFFQQIIVPMQRSHKAHLEKNPTRALEELENMPKDNDWKYACKQWLNK